MLQYEGLDRLARRDHHEAHRKRRFAMATALREDASFETEVRNLRRELAACFRLCALFGWDDHIATHISARLSDGTFLLNPSGLFFDEITASSLMRVDMDGNVLEPEGNTMNPAAYTIHSGVLAARPDVNCVVHLHTRDGAAVSAIEDGLMPLNQTSLLIYHDIAYHEFEGVAINLAERERLQNDLGDKNLMILRNHGTLAAGVSIGSAFYRMYTLEWACSAQVRALSMGREIHFPAQDVQDKMAGNTLWKGFEKLADSAFWPGMLRKAERECPGFDA